MSAEQNARPVAVVTGASAGIGAAFAERLAQDGYDLIIVARRRERLEELAKRLEAGHDNRVEVFAADLARGTDLGRLEERILEEPALTMLVNNAGFGAYMPFVNLDPGRAEESIRLQVIALTRLTRAALPGMIERGRGDVINVASRLAFSGPLTLPTLPKRAVYASSKAFIVAFTQILNSELQGTGVRVQALCPGVVRTEFHEIQGMDPSRYPSHIVMTPEDLVSASLKGLELREVICIPALDDTGLIAQFEQAEGNLFQVSVTGEIAERYRA